MKDVADTEQLLCINGGFIEKFLQGARGDTDLVGEPGVGVALATQFFAD